MGQLFEDCTSIGSAHLKHIQLGSPGHKKKSVVLQAQALRIPVGPPEELPTDYRSGGKKTMLGLTSLFSPLSPLLPQHQAPQRHSISASTRSSSTSMDPDPNRKRVVVCGGGVIGVCTAYFLSKKGAAVTLVEQSSVACAASGKAGGFLALDWCDGGPMQCLARASFELHSSLAAELNGPESYGYRALTTLGLTIKEPGDISHAAPTSGSKPSGLPDWVDGPAKGVRVIGSDETTAQVHPQFFTRTLLSKAVNDYGLEVVIGKVQRVDTVGGRVQSVVLEGGRDFGADSVVLALGPWSGKFGLLSSLFGVYGLKAHSIVLEPKEPDAVTPHALFLSFAPREGGLPMDPEVYPRPTGTPMLLFVLKLPHLAEENRT